MIYMFMVDSVPILTDDVEILRELRDQLMINGLDRFRTIRSTVNSIQVTCPIHNDGRERKPSCGISRSVVVKGGRNIPAGWVHCFTCGYSVSLEEMVSNCFGYDDYGMFGKRWLLKNFMSLAVEDRPDLNLMLDRSIEAKSMVELVSEEELAKYRFYHEYMWDRKLTREIIEIFDVGFDDSFVLRDSRGQVKGSFECLTFPVQDQLGQCIFIARRSVTGKLFHYPASVTKPVYGIYQLLQYYPDIDELIICESIINALTCWVYGKPAVALMGLGTKIQYDELLDLKCRKFITGFDPDQAGQGATEKFKRYIGNKRIVTSYVLPNGKDLNDLTKKEFDSLVEIF